MRNNITIYVAAIVVCGVMGLVLLSQRLVVVSQRITDPEHVNNTAHRIADFDLPPGYQTDYVLDVGGYTIAAYKFGASQSHLSFVQVPVGVIPDDEVIEGHIYGGWSRKSERQADVLSTEQITVRNHPATLTISERTNGEGQRYRSAYLVFNGKNGQSVFVINQPIEQWNREFADTVIASIH